MHWSRIPNLCILIPDRLSRAYRVSCYSETVSTGNRIISLTPSRFNSKVPIARVVECPQNLLPFIAFRPSMDGVLGCNDNVPVVPFCLVVVDETSWHFSSKLKGCVSQFTFFTELPEQKSGRQRLKPINGKIMNQY